MKQLLIAVVLVLFVTGCNKTKSYGKEIPTNAESISLTELLANPGNYHDKKVTLKGTVSGQCGNKCEFTFRENNNSHTIYVGDIEAPTIQKGTPITVNAHVFNGEQKLVLTAQGFELKGK